MRVFSETYAFTIARIVDLLLRMETRVPNGKLLSVRSERSTALCDWRVNSLQNACEIDSFSFVRGLGGSNVRGSSYCESIDSDSVADVLGHSLTRTGFDAY